MVCLKRWQHHLKMLVAGAAVLQVVGVAPHGRREMVCEVRLVLKYKSTHVHEARIQHPPQFHPDLKRQEGDGLRGVCVHSAAIEENLSHRHSTRTSFGAHCLCTLATLVASKHWWPEEQSAQANAAATNPAIWPMQLLQACVVGCSIRCLQSSLADGTSCHYLTCLTQQL
jgi:hypothetical protein